jgi:transcriptional regulator with XRE-family HTH domain
MNQARHLVPVFTHEQLGRALRLARKHQSLRQDEVGALSHSFIGEVENGKPTAQIGKVFELLRELGLRLYIELPADARDPVPGEKNLKRTRRARGAA